LGWLTIRLEHGKMRKSREDERVDLSQKSTENVEYMIEKIKEKLRMLNFGAIKPSHFDEEMYEELKDLYDMVMKKTSFSPNEMQAIAEELGNLRKQ
jgi:uncharacterized protein YfkK (UPF0435 family)